MDIKLSKRISGAIEVAPLPGPHIAVLALAVAVTLGGCSASGASEAERQDGPGAAATEEERPAQAPATQADRPAEAARTPVEEPERRHTVPLGTTMTFRIDEDVSTGTHRKGDIFASSLVGDVVGVEGEVVLPAGSIGRWSVVESVEDDGEGDSVLSVRLAAVEVGGARYPVDATIISSEIDTDDADSKSETAAKIGIGAVAGAVVGRLLGGDAKDALKGAGVGAAMGAVVALSTRGGSAKLPAGSRLVIRLDEPLVLAGR